ncbi:helix-turn-helix domain-containing protein [soil metagenome]
MTEIAKLPFSLFTTGHLRPSEQFEAWHQSISVIFDVAPLAGHSPESGFDALVRGYHLGGLLVSQVDFEGQRFLRDKRRAIVDGLDHYLVQLYTTGGLIGAAGDRERVLRAGDVQILDLTQPNVTEAKASGTVSIVVPRDTLRRALPTAGDLHGLVLPGDSGTGGLLADYMRSLIARADTITVADAAIIAQATTDMIAACSQSTAETVARARTSIEMTMLERIQRYIATHLASELHADALCGLFGMSRTRLYRLFEPLGGVANYIQEQRLGRAKSELANPAHDHRRIYDIAFNLGFTSEAHFSRVFRSTFGLSPSDLRARSHTLLSRVDGQIEIGPADRGYEDWLRQLKSTA